MVQCVVYNIVKYLVWLL